LDNKKLLVIPQVPSVDVYAATIVHSNYLDQPLNFLSPKHH